MINKERFDAITKNGTMEKKDYYSLDGIYFCKNRLPDEKELNQVERQTVLHLFSATRYINNYMISAIDVRAHLETKLNKSDSDFYFEYVIEVMERNIRLSIEAQNAKNNYAKANKK